jgi:hypothetical protein
LKKEKRKAAILTMMGAPVMDENMFEGRLGGGGRGLEMGRRDGHYHHCRRRRENEIFHCTHAISQRGALLKKIGDVRTSPRGFVMF